MSVKEKVCGCAVNNIHSHIIYTLNPNRTKKYFWYSKLALTTLLLGSHTSDAFSTSSLGFGQDLLLINRINGRSNGLLFLTLSYIGSGVHPGLSLSLESCRGSKLPDHKQPHGEAHLSQQGIR